MMAIGDYYLTGDTVIQLAIGAGGILLISLAVALLARTMRRLEREMKEE